MKIAVISLGCSKNLVDTEKLLGMFVKAGIDAQLCETVDEAQTVIVNTCGFIQDAKEESVNTILECAQAKDEGRIEHLYVMGCLSERYRKELKEEIPQIDKVFGKFDWEGLCEQCSNAESVDSAKVRGTSLIDRVLTTPSHYAYLKISEGCDRKCAYCAIPIMTGKHKSKAKSDILDEVRLLVAQGVKEFQVIAQELTYYGIDIDGKQHIAELIEEMANIEGVEWIRLHYAYPTKFPMDLLRVIRENDNVCNYLDIAFQHISDNVLERMKRNFTKQETYDLIKKIREEVPGIHIRTTLMVGYPGETENDFEELIDFVRWARFERMGAFAYSEEDGTYAAEHYKDNIPEKVKQKRLEQLMALQQDIAEEIEDEKVGKAFKVIVDSREGDYYIARSEFSSPEVDPEILIDANEKELEIGEIYNVEITDAVIFDSYAKLL